jgi:hypothetical protein
MHCAPVLLRPGSCAMCHAPTSLKQRSTKFFGRRPCWGCITNKCTAFDNPETLCLVHSLTQADLLETMSLAAGAPEGLDLDAPHKQHITRSTAQLSSPSTQTISPSFPPPPCHPPRLQGIPPLASSLQTPLAVQAAQHKLPCLLPTAQELESTCTATAAAPHTAHV